MGWAPLTGRVLAMDAQSTRDARGAGPGMYAENAAVRRSGAIFRRNDGSFGFKVACLQA